MLALFHHSVCRLFVAHEILHAQVKVQCSNRNLLFTVTSCLALFDPRNTCARSNLLDHLAWSVPFLCFVFAHIFFAFLLACVKEFSCAAWPALSNLFLPQNKRSFDLVVQTFRRDNELGSSCMRFMVSLFIIHPPPPPFHRPADGQGIDPGALRLSLAISDNIPENGLLVRSSSFNRLERRSPVVGQRLSKDMGGTHLGLEQNFGPGERTPLSSSKRCMHIGYLGIRPFCAMCGENIIVQGLCTHEGYRQYPFCALCGLQIKMV